MIQQPTSLKTYLSLFFLFALLGLSSAQTCPAGKSCNADGSNQQDCAAGTFAETNQFACLDCPNGTKCPGTAQTSATACSAGEYQNQAGQTQCLTCPAGHMCPYKTIDPLPCPLGYYTTTGQSTCTICQAGQFCPPYAAAATTCPTGTYSKQASVSCTACPAGFTCDSDASANPTVCTFGDYKAIEGPGTCDTCAAGQECMDRSGLPSSCPFGFNSASGDGICASNIVADTENANLADTSTNACVAGTYFDWWSTPPQCKPCEPGQICLADFTKTECPKGYYNNNDVCTACPAGSICPDADSAPTVCPAGFYQDLTGSFLCKQIPPGYTVTNTGTPSTLAACASGKYFSTKGECEDCPAGFMCPDPAFRPIPCVPGEYTTTGQTACAKCPAGSYCKKTNQVPVAVDADYYAPEGSINQLSCPPGWECSTSAVINPICQWGYYHDGTSCIICPAGKMCTQVRSHTPLDCPDGSYSLQGWMMCIPCAPGYECTTDGATITQCQNGQYSFESETSCTWGRTNYFTPIKESSVNAPCPPGSYQDSDRHTCIPCPFNKKCPVTNKSSLINNYTPLSATAQDCGAGEYAQAGDGFCMANEPGTDGTNICLPGTYSNGDACTNCPVGHYCSDPSLLPVPCPPGTYQDSTTQTNCKVCGAGTECLFASTTNTQCQAGYYCPASWEPKKICPAGYSSAQGATKCSPCPDTKYCPFAGNVAGSEADCPANMYCSTPFDGSLPVYQLCPAGTYSTLGSAAVVGDCATCSLGKYCEMTLAARLIDCPKGHYCPAGTEYATQYPCPFGKFNPNTAQDGPQDCTPCSSGKYCFEGSQQDGPNCPYGAQCGAGADNSVLEIWCAGGTYSNELGGQTACISCPPGHYCPYGSATALPCPPGTYRTGGSASYLAQCLPCDAGTACRLPGSTTSTGQACADGHFCPAGTESPYQFPCPYGTWANSVTDLQSRTGCVNCPQGYACGLATFNDADRIPCAPGHYCPTGTSSPYSFPCTAGTYQSLKGTSADTDCVNCPAGYFCPPGSSTPTQLCPPGYFCPLNTKQRYQNPCPSGKYQPKWGQINSNACINCPAGYFCLLGSDYPWKCPAGHYCAAQSELPGPSTLTSGSPQFNTRNSGQVAQAGKYSPRGGGTQLNCPDKMYSAEGMDRCLTCPKGYMCKTNNRAIDTVITSKQCTQGKWCEEGAGNSLTSCPLGMYCTTGSLYPQQCRAGDYSAVAGKSSRDQCTNTNPGYWTPPGAISGTKYPCEPGNYCPQNSIQADQTPCQAGTYRASTQATLIGNCINCPRGHYCPEGTFDPIPCGDGHYCNSLGMSEPSQCPPGSYSSVQDEQTTSCTPCPIGQSCTHYGLSKPDFLCAPGYLCTQGSAQTSDPSLLCTAGGYCELGTSVKESCRPSTYNPDTGKSYLLDCQYCPEGKYCSGGASSSPTNDCDAGYYCTGQSFTPKQEVTLPGYYTLAGDSAMRECTAKKYQDLFAQSDCKSCEAGFYCNTVANDGQARVICPAGFFCQIESQSPEKCPVGTFSYKLGLTSDTECLPCLPGYYCPTAGIKEKAEMTQCSAGYFCKQSAIIGTPETDPTNAGRYGPCPQGHYCPAGTADPIPCPPGTFSASEKLQAKGSCTQCTAGKYCPTEGLTAATLDCDAGYFCPAGEKVRRNSANACAAGFYCPTGSSIQLECPEGYYQDNTRQSICLICPDGYSCVNSKVTPEPCPAGSFCGSGNVNLCPAGRYNPITFTTASTQCAVCPPGKICTTDGLTTYTSPTNCPAGFYCSPLGDKAAGDKTGQCTAGYYCAQNSALPIDCPGGHYCDGGATFTKCLAGYYCTTRATKANPTTAAEGGGVCPAGYYCPTGSDSPIACPPGTYNPSTGGQTSANCLDCPAGKYCQNAGQISSTGSCSSGYYCPSATRSVPHPVSTVCPKDNYCDGTASAKPCATNSQYQPNTGQSACLACPAGFLCSPTGFTNCNTDFQSYCDQNYATQSCTSGSYTPSVNAASSSDCVQITAGYQFTVTGGGTTFTQTKCPAGKYCEQGSALPKECPQGYYCPEGSATPLKCQAGKYCAGVDNQAPDGDCDAGYYCIEGATTKTPTDGTTGNICPKGHYCLPGSSAPTACPIGTYRSAIQGTQQNDCTPCDAGRYCDALGLENPSILCYEGYFCDPSSTSPNPREHSCPPGYKCPAGSTDKTACLAGQYQPLPLKGSCQPCPERYYCESTATSMPKICPKGKYCPEGTSVPSNCLAGYYNDRYGLKSQNQCSPCPVGYYCATDGLTAITNSQKCDAGFYCNGGSTSAQQYSCPLGYYCPLGTYNPLPCPIGTYSESTELQAESGCTDCSVGYYCSLKAASKTQIESDTYKCAAGFICLGKAITPTPTDIATEGGRYCATGKYCVRGATSETNCAKGTYNPYQGQQSCITCPAGRLCATEGLTAFTNCPAGKYCPAGITAAVDCPPGTYSPMENLESESQCLECDPGKYCSGGSATTSGDCDAGYSCPRGSSQKDPPAAFSFSPLTGGVCPTGHYCEPGNQLPTQCPEGKYNDETGKINQAGCKDCPAGYYCDELGLITPYKKCSAGYFCISGSQVPKPIDGTKGRACSKGKFCLEGTSTQVSCVAGTYEPRTGSSACQKCPAGYFCTLGAIKPTPCPAKYYCPAGAPSGTFCPDGTYSNTVGLELASQCTACTTSNYCSDGEIKGQCVAGYFCHSGAQTASPSTMQCPIGHYCDIGSIAPTICPDGKVNPNPGGDALADCVNCPLGYYCIQGTATICPAGHYCDGNNSGANIDPKQCPIDTYNLLQGQQGIANCLACDAGYLCSDTAIANLEFYKCPKGKYCLNDATQGVITPAADCPNGTYNDERGIGAENECKQCPAGSYCAAGSIYPLKCPSGYYCPLGSDVPTLCEPGYYCPYNSPSPTTCPPGYYCPNQKTDLYLKCPPGTYCPSGSIAPTPCPAGSYSLNNPNNYQEADECYVCEQGTYLAAPGSLLCLPCTPGYTCEGGTITATPTDLAVDKGQICPAGFYCPQGSWDPIACPKGTYQPNTAESSSSSCLICPRNFFSEKEGQTQCKSCGSNAYNLGQGQSSCACFGKNRNFQPEKSHCMCNTGYEPVGNDDFGNSANDCQPVVYPLCATNQVYNDKRQCVSENDCNSQCTEAIGGRVIYNIGLCECIQLVDSNSFCDSTCRTSKTSYTLDYQNNIVATYADGTVATVGKSTLSGMFGDPNCPSSCKLYAVNFSGSFFSGNYDMVSSVSTYVDSQPRSLLAPQRNPSRAMQSTSEIINPIFCITEGETLVFQVNYDAGGNHQYPIYDTGSLLNTVSSFDYSAFSKLEGQLKAGNPISSFAFTFVDPGTYAFVNSLDSEKRLVVAVKDQAVACPSDAYIMPTSYQNLLSAGVTPMSDLIYEPNWWLIGGILFAFVMLAVITILLILYYKKKVWRLRGQSRIPYRELQRAVDFEEVEPKRGVIFKKAESEDTHSSRLSSHSSQDSEQRREQERKKLRGERYAIEESQLDQMLNKADRIQMEFTSTDDRDEDMYRIIQMRINALIEKLRRIREGDEVEEPVPKEVENQGEDEATKQANKREEDRLKEQKRIQREQERQMNKMDSDKRAYMEKMLREGDERQRKFMEMLDKSKLSEEQKDKLLQDFMNNAERVNMILEEEERKQQEDLQRKLDERRQKRLRLRERIEQLENERDHKSKELKDGLEDLNDETAAKLNQINDQLEKEQEEVLEKTRAKLQKQREEKRQGFQNMLAKNKRPDDVQKLISDYEEDSHSLERKLQMELAEQKKSLQQILAQRRERHRLQLENERREREKELLSSKQEEVKNLDEEIQRLKRIAEDENLNERIENIVDAKLRQENVRLEKMKDASQEELDELQKKHQEQMDRLEVATVSTDVQDDLDRQKELLDFEDEKESIEDQQRRKEDLQRQIEECDDEALKAQLMKQLKENEEALMLRLKKEQEQQKSNLENKLAARKMKKLERKKGLLEKQDQEKRRLKEKLQSDQNQMKQELGSKDLAQIIKDINQNVEINERPYAIQKAVDQKHASQLSELLMRQFIEKAEELQDSMLRLMEQKTQELKILKELFQKKRDAVQEMRGQLGDQECDRRLKQLDDQEQEKKDDIEDKYLERQASEENEITKRLLGKHTDEMLELKKRQSEEKKYIIENFIPPGMARDLFADNLDDINQELEKFKQQLEERKQRELAALAEREKILREQRDKYKQRMERMDQFGNFLSQHQLFDQKKQGKRFGMEDTALQEAQKKLIEGYKERDVEMQKLLQSEQARQKDLMDDKIQKKKAMREEYRKKRMQELEELKQEQEKEKQQEEQKHQLQKDSIFEKILMEYVEEEEVFDKVKGAFKIDQNKKNAFVERQRLKVVAPLTPTRSLSGSPLRSGLGSRNLGKRELLINPTQVVHKQAILTDDEILAKLMMKISSIEDKVYRIDKQVKH